MSTFLLEIGTEELPAEFSKLVVPQLKERVEKDLKQKRLDHGVISCTSTPRRIALIVSNLPQKAHDYVKEQKGPPASQAFVDGSPLPAAIGFAARCNVLPEQLTIKETPKGPFVFANLLEEGLSTQDLMVDLIPKWISCLQGKRFMRWGSGDFRFSRPIRWIVCLLDSSKISINIKGSDPQVTSNTFTKGHRLYDNEIVLTTAEKYQDLLRRAGVIVDRDERLNLVKELIESSSSEINAVPDLPLVLLHELTDLVELPSIVRGTFDESFLELPPEVLCTVMQYHQRYIPLYLKDIKFEPLSLNSRGILMPSFLCISNGLTTSNNLIRKGNERVLKARLSDAKFFINFDLGIPSTRRREQLNAVTFADGLGSLLDRVERIQWISEKLVEYLNLSMPDAINLCRAASFCKHDLVSKMVGEFPELQGSIGGKYLLHEGEPREVALAVLEHYLPCVAGGSLPESMMGAFLSIADKIELLVSIFSKGERPTGSSDPFALKRAANGILLIVWDKEIFIDLLKLFDELLSYWAVTLPSLEIKPELIVSELSEFFRQRIISLLEDSGVDADLVQAVCGETIPIKRLLSNPLDAQRRAKLLVELRKSGQLQGVQSVVTRAAKLADKSDFSLDILSADNVVDTSLFEKECEHEMLKVINILEPIALSSTEDRYIELANGLFAGKEVLASFFDGESSVMVMTDNESIRNNRLNLLSVLRNQAFVIADFNVIAN